jgi:hypothetical protein
VGAKKLPLTVFWLPKISIIWSTVCASPQTPSFPGTPKSLVMHSVVPKSPGDYPPPSFVTHPCYLSTVPVSPGILSWSLLPPRAQSCTVWCLGPWEPHSGKGFPTSNLKTLLPQKMARSKCPVQRHHHSSPAMPYAVWPAWCWGPYD